MSFTGTVASHVWDRLSSWSFQENQHFSFAKLPIGYICTFSVLAVRWAVNSGRHDTGHTASALEQERNCTTLTHRFGWHMQEGKMVHVQKKKANTHQRHEAERQRGSSSKCPLLTTHKEDNCKVSSSSGVIGQFWICVVALWGLEAPHSLDL